MHVLAAAGSDPGGAIAGFAIITGSILAYWAPVIIAVIRHVPNAGSVAVIDGFLGWTVVGWIVALAMACRSVPARPAPPLARPSWPEQLR